MRIIKAGKAIAFIENENVDIKFHDGENEVYEVDKLSEKDRKILQKDPDKIKDMTKIKRRDK